MAKALVAALLVSAAAYAQTSPGGGTNPNAAGATTGETPATADAPATGVPGDVERSMDQKVEDAKKELRDEIRAHLATQSAAEGWEEEWVEETRKLELLELDGYLRVRPELFNKLDLGRQPDPGGYSLFARSPISEAERTIAGTNMRARVEPTINVSEEVRARFQIDALDNLVFGSTPDYAWSRSAWNEFGIFSESQLPPRSGINSLEDSIQVKRAYGEVSTPVGILRFGRMGSHWGLGMLRHDGDCIECDFGDTVDRIQFVTEPFTGWYVAPMVDFNSEGPVSTLVEDEDDPRDLARSDDSHSWVLAIARRDTPQQIRAKLDNNLSVFNYGLHFTYRTQKNEFVDSLNGAFPSDPGASGINVGFVPREATLYVPDLWARFERKNFRLEVELAAVLGQIDNRALLPASAANPDLNQSLRIVQFGGVFQGEYRFLDGDLKLQVELGFASGDKAPGLGNRPRRPGTGPNGSTQIGDIEGPQYSCAGTLCADDAIRNFRFNRAYRVDMILWREILGTVSDAMYGKPTVTYSLADGFDLFGSIIYSRAVYAESTPSGRNPNLGIELDLGAKYETEDGFIAGFGWGILFPLSGLKNFNQPGTDNSLDTAQSLRATLGVKF